MKSHFSKLRILSIAAGFTFASAVQAATTVTFENLSAFYPGANGTVEFDIPGSTSDFADFVTATGPGVEASMGVEFVGTPNLDISWNVSGLTQYYQDWNGRTDVAQLEYNQTGATNPIQWSIAPNLGSIAVIINSFDLDVWSGGGDAQISWAVSGSISGTLASGTWARSNVGRDTVSPNVTGAAGETLTLSFTRVSGLGNYLALDNLTFDQITIPEPSGAILASVGLGLLTLRRRR